MPCLRAPQWCSGTCPTSPHSFLTGLNWFGFFMQELPVFCLTPKTSKNHYSLLIMKIIIIKLKNHFGCLDASYVTPRLSVYLIVWHLFFTHSGLHPLSKTHLLFECSCVLDIFRKPFSDSCNLQRWHRPSIQLLRMNQCPQMPAQSQNTHSTSLRVISQPVIILFRSIMCFEGKFRLTSAKGGKKTHFVLLKF